MNSKVSPGFVPGSINAGIYDSAHLIFHGPSVHRKISERF